MVALWMGRSGIDPFLLHGFVVTWVGTLLMQPHAVRLKRINAQAVNGASAVAFAALFGHVIAHLAIGAIVAVAIQFPFGINGLAERFHIVRKDRRH